jgi:hypothetical protein
MKDHRLDTEDLPPPIGTLAILGGYIVLLALLWGALYVELLGR